MDSEYVAGLNDMRRFACGLVDALEWKAIREDEPAMAAYFHELSEQIASYRRAGIAGGLTAEEKNG